MRNAAATRQAIQKISGMTERMADDGWILATEHDGWHGYNWYATRGGVLWAKGWIRTTSENQASEQAELVGRAANMGGL